MVIKSRGVPGFARAAALCALGLLPGLGCADARHVMIEPAKGGVVALHVDNAPSRQKALELMGMNCREGFEILREEEVPVGSRMSGEKTTSRDRSEETTTREEYSVRVKTEWRITYRCR